MIGDYVPAGAPMFQLSGGSGRLRQDKVLRAIDQGLERTINQDAAYGFRMLVDVAVRSLSEAFDPTTAVQAIDRLHDCLRQLARRPFPPGEYFDEDGVLRLRVAQITWEGYVHLAFDEIRQTGANSAQVIRRLKAALDDLQSIAPPERQEALARQVELLNAAVASNDWPETDRRTLSSDPQGIGSAKGLRAVLVDSTNTSA